MEARSMDFSFSERFEVKETSDLVLDLYTHFAPELDEMAIQIDDLTTVTEKIHNKLTRRYSKKGKTLQETFDFELIKHISDHWSELSEYLVNKDPEHKGILPVSVWHEALCSIMPYLNLEVLERVDVA